MKRARDQVSQSHDNNVLAISTIKTNIVHQPVLGKPYNELTITAKDTN